MSVQTSIEQTSVEQTSDQPSVEQTSDQTSLSIFMCVNCEDILGCEGGCVRVSTKIKFLESKTCECVYNPKECSHDTYNIRPQQYVLVSFRQREGTGCCGESDCTYDITVFATKEEADAECGILIEKFKTDDEMTYEHSVYSFSELEQMETF